MKPPGYLSANLTINTTITPSKTLSLGETGQDDEFTKKRCFPIGDCERCDVEMKEESKPIAEACDATGRRKKIECVVLREDKELQRFESYRPCDRTIADEEMMMVQMQIICALIGFCSLLAMQKQKKASASLFDRRKRINENYFWQGTEISNANATANAPKSKVGGKQVISTGNIELV